MIIPGYIWHLPPSCIGSLEDVRREDLVHGFYIIIMHDIWHIFMALFASHSYYNILWRSSCTIWMHCNVLQWMYIIMSNVMLMFRFSIVDWWVQTFLSNCGILCKSCLRDRVQRSMSKKKEIVFNFSSATRGQKGFLSDFEKLLY